MDHGDGSALCHDAASAVSDYLRQVRWAGSGGIGRHLKRMNHAAEPGDIVGYLDGNSAFTQRSGLYCHVKDVEALRHHIDSIERGKCSSAPRSTGTAATRPRRVTLKRTKVSPNRAVTTGVCAYCGKTAEFANDHTTWGSVKLCYTHLKMMTSRRIGPPTPLSIHVIYTGMGTGRRS